MVQVFARADQSCDSQQSFRDEDDMNGYQLLNEVGSGGTLSSLFTILSLFTEDVPMSWQDDDPHVTTDVAEGGFETPPSQYRTRRANSDVSHLDLSSKFPGKATPRPSSTASTTSTVKSPAAPSSPSLSVMMETETISPRHRQIHLQSQVHQGVIARAKVDSTLAVIPAEAFGRLTKNFPKASSHIVQGMSEK